MSPLSSFFDEVEERLHQTASAKSEEEGGETLAGTPQPESDRCDD
jgi:hypothetical protein